MTYVMLFSAIPLIDRLSSIRCGFVTMFECNFMLLLLLLLLSFKYMSLFDWHKAKIVLYICQEAEHILERIDQLHLEFAKRAAVSKL